MNNIDSNIHEIRRAISEVFEEFESTTEDLVKFLDVADEHAYHSVVDSLYLLEDTQLAKHEFDNLQIKEETAGRLYLFFYGVLNSCYMQQQAILVICENLGISDNIVDIRSAEIVAYRNDFSAHSPNRGHCNDKHSFILNRTAMKRGEVAGYTANHKHGTVFREANIYKLVSDWNLILDKQLELVASQLLSEKT